VGVAFVRDDDSGTIIPDPGEVNDVQDYIDDRRPVTATVTVYAPQADPLDFNISVTPNTQPVKDAVQAELEDFIRRTAEPGGTLLISQIREAISSAAGEFAHVLHSPLTDQVAASGDIFVMGNITWT